MVPSSISTRRLIAQEAGLSPTTVSLVLNDRADAVGIKPETQRRVREIARRHNYVPNPLARGLLGKSTKTVGLLWGMGGTHISGEITQDISLRLQKRGYITHLTNSLSDPIIVRRQLADYQRRGVDAVVIQQGMGELLTEELCRQLMGFRAAVAVSPKPPAVEMDWIHHDMLAGYREAADHLARIGRRRPAIFAPLAKSEAKVETFLGQCRQRGMEVSDASAIDLLYDGQVRHLAAAGRQSLESRFSGTFPFDALMCSVDEVAGAAMAWLRGRGLRVPEDVAVIGCNDALLSESLTPPLASLQRQEAEVARAVEEMIFARLADSALPPQKRHIAARLVWRESAGEIPGHGTAQGDQFIAGRHP